MELPNESVRRAIVQRYADLLTRVGDELGERPLVLPTAEFFPDTFQGDETGLRRLVTRMQRHAGMDDIPIRAHAVGDAPAPSGSSCSSGACSVPLAPQGAPPRLVDAGEHWDLNVPTAELGAPVVLTTMIARALGRVFLVETTEGAIPAPVDVSADLTAVMLGFGPLLLEGGYIYSKSCGGPQIGRATHLGVGDLAIATAIFVRLGNHRHRPALKELGTTQRALFGEALDWSKSNASVLDRLATDPAALSEGNFELADAQPWLLRMFGKRSKSADALPDDFTVADLEALVPPSTNPMSTREHAPRDPKRDELSALVAEALTEARADAE